MTTEQRRIQAILRGVAKHPSRSVSPLVASLGLDALDDCAVVPLTGELDLVLGSDFVRGEHFHLFRRNILDWFDVGYFLVGANVSDLAAMGATPLGLLCVMRYSHTMTDDEFEQVMEGVAAACSEFDIPLLGGDTGGYETSVLSATALGICPHGRALQRGNGQPGDSLFLTGPVGAAGAAIAYFMRTSHHDHTLSPADQEQLAAAWRRVAPAVRQGMLLVSENLSRCAIDTSDGLKAACRLLAQASDVRVVLDADRIPISPLATKVAHILGVDPLALAVSDSVDFRLLFSSPREHVQAVRAAFDREHWELYEIGQLAAVIDAPMVTVVQEGEERPLGGVEWDQSSVPAIERLRSSAMPGVVSATPVPHVV